MKLSVFIQFVLGIIFLHALHGIEATKTSIRMIPDDSSSLQNAYFNLGGKWTVVNRNGSISVDALVPGVIHTDLMRAGMIDDPYYRFNDVEYRWISMDDWTYSTTFELDSAFATMDSIDLWMDGLQTFATVTLNGERILENDNMFHIHRIPVKEFIDQSGKNTISIAFTSTVVVAKQKESEYPYPVPLNPDYVTYQGEPNRNFVRTSQASFGWDFGPCFVPQGIWRDIALIGYNEVAIEDVSIETFPVNGLDSFVVNATVLFRVAKEMDVDLTATIAGITGKSTAHCLAGVQCAHIVSVEVDNVELWYPAGYGKQNLYPMDISAKGPSGSSDEKKLTVGFRKVELRTDEVPNGNLFYLKVNDIPVFVKGSNLVPMDSFESRVTDDVVDDILESAVTANMNMVRVWGGGVFNSDHFYEKCDELGIMVWEEFKFGCALCPRDDAFLASVSKEIKDQMRRLSKHVSIALWSGNNENELTLSWTQGVAEHRDMYVVDYTELYLNTIRTAVLSVDTSRPFWPSSPSNGPISESPYVMRWGNGGDSARGDVHFYDYDNLCTRPSMYPKPRFASEFGFQSYPGIHSIEKVTDPSDRNLNSEWMSKRQHHPNGNQELVKQISDHFAYSGNTSYENFLWLSQSMHGLCMKSETEHYRRLKGDPDVHTMGTMYWQLNSMWEAPSWSSLEYGGKWKQLQYVVKKAYEPIIASAYTDDDDITVYFWVTSDVNKEMSTTLLINVYHFADGKLGFTQKFQTTLNPLESKEAGQVLMLYLMTMGGCKDTSDCFLELELIDQSSQDLIYSQWHFLTPLHASPLPQSNITLSSFCSQVKERTCPFVVQSDQVAVFVVLDSTLRGEFSDNVLVLRPGVEKVLNFHGKEDFTPSQFQSSISVKSLVDTL